LNCPLRANPHAVVSTGESFKEDGFDASGFAQFVPGMGSFFVKMTLFAGAVAVYSGYPTLQV